MIEIPRAALTAGEIATEAEFFSFGTNDLTQTTFGYSRDDAERQASRLREKGYAPYIVTAEVALNFTMPPRTSRTCESTWPMEPASISLRLR